MNCNYELTKLQVHVLRVSLYSEWCCQLVSKDWIWTANNHYDKTMQTILFTVKAHNNK